MSLVIRPGRPADAAACGSICFEAFAAIADEHRFPRPYPDAETAAALCASLLAREDFCCFVAERGGRIVGSNFMSESGPIGGVGPITVHPDEQNSTVGRQLMERVLERAYERHLVGVRLVQAAYHNRTLALYTKLGFDVKEPLSVMQGPALGLIVPGHHVRPATEQDLQACNAVSFRVHGYDRGTELRHAIRQGTASVVEHDGRITGYASLIGFPGHAVGESDADLKALIGAARSFAGPGFLLPSRRSALLRWCLAHGLRVAQPMSLMSLGLYNEPAGAFLPSILY